MATVSTAPSEPARTPLSGKRLVILQDAVMPYRRAFYSRLGEYLDVCVVHSGAPSARGDDHYREIIVPVVKVGPFRIQALSRALEALKPIDAALVIFDLRWPLTLWTASRLRSTRRLLWGHRHSRRKIVNWLRFAIMRKFDGMVQYGEEEIPAMLGAGIERERIFVAPNTVDVPNSVDTSTHSKSSFIYVGRLQPRKRLDELLRAFAAVAGRIPKNLRVEMVGDGPIRADLEAEALSLGIADRVVFHGAITDPDALYPIFARSIAYVSPDNVGLGVLHAFAYGVPVVTGQPRDCNLPGYRHGPEFQNIKSGINGVIFADDAALQDCLVRLATDREYSSNLGRNAFLDYSNNRSIDAMARGIVSAVENDTSSAPPSAHELVAAPCAD